MALVDGGQDRTPIRAYADGVVGWVAPMTPLAAVGSLQEWAVYREASGAGQATVRVLRAHEGVRYVDFQYVDADGWSGRSTLTEDAFVAKFPALKRRPMVEP